MPIPNLKFEEYYKLVPKEKNDTTNYNLRRAYELAPEDQLRNFITDKNAHLFSTYKDPKTGVYDFVKSKNHPTLKYELDWYNSNKKDAKQFRNEYQLDTTGLYYHYRPKFKNGGIIKRVEKAKSGIHIKPENKGKFTETMKRTGKSAEELSHSKNPVTRKRAIFALNARKWHHGK